MSCTPREREKVFRNKNFPDKACKTCGSSFSPRFGHSKYCSDECRQRDYSDKTKKVHPPRNCDACEKTYQPKSSFNKYCSNRCRNKHYYEVNLKKNKGKQPKECVVCKTSFTPYRSLDICCSKSCSDIRARKAKAKNITCASCGCEFIHTKTGVRKYCDACKVSGRPKKISKHPCAYCGKTHFPHVNTHATYCSLKCSSKALHAKGKGNKLDTQESLDKLIKAIQDARYTPTLEDVCHISGISETWVREQGLDIEALFNMAKRPHVCSYESKFEEMVYYALLDLGIQETDLEKQKKFPNLRGIRNSLRYDFYIETIKVLVEADGDQHNPNETHPRFETEACHKNDAKKNSYAEEHGIPLIRIPYQATFQRTFDAVKENLTPHLKTR